MKIRIALTTVSVTLFLLAMVQLAWAQSKHSRNANEYDQTARMGMYYAVMCELSSADGQTVQARAYAEKAVLLLENPSDDFEFYAKGVAYEVLGHYDIALDNFDKAIQYDPQKIISYIRRGRVYSQKGNFDRALADFNKAIQLEAEKSADGEQDKSSPNKADNDSPTTDIDELIQRDPRPWFENFRPGAAYFDRGKTYLQKDDNDRAIADFTKAIELDPKRAIAYNYRGVAYGSKGDFDQAIADFDKALQLNPLLRNAHYNRGLAFSEKGDEARARADFEKEKQLYPGNNSIADHQNDAAGTTERGEKDSDVCQDCAKNSSDSLRGGVLNGRAVKLAKPKYPHAARKSHASGLVVVHVVIDEQGKVIAAEATSGDPLLHDVCVEAAKNSLFTPTLLAGMPVKVTGVIHYNFVAQ